MLLCATVCCIVLQRVALCCSVLQCVAACCSVLHSFSSSEIIDVLQAVADLDNRSLLCSAVCCIMLLCVAVCCSVLQCAVVCCSVF